ncbi:MAG: ISNCY family transposase [Candidatus Omnitrophica bacterium]|nr:ISNCY family transposase [Candidatus Omnitrophota bacterium]
MSQGECHRLHIVRKAIDKELTQVEAGEILDLSYRQIKRIVKRVREEGDTGIAHKLRGKKSNRAIAVQVKEKVLKLYKEKYPDFGPLLASEKITELDKINIKDDVLRNWLLKAGLWQLSRKQRKHRRWRERKHRLGTMLQGDGSHHDWFEGRGAKCVLMGWIDDATSRVYARFYEYEGTLPAMDSFKRYIKKYGFPYSVYLDKHPTYKSTAKQTIEDELENRKRLSQFERAVKELGVVLIHANSPQAKGRIERLFRTFQDRVIKEMRLKGVKNISEANTFLRYYLPVFNRRFGVKAIEEGDLHRAVSAEIDLDRILCIKIPRSLRNDFTVAHDTKLYQVLDDITTKKVIVEDRVNGKRFIVYKDKDLKYKEITQRPVKKSSKTTKVKRRRAYTPAKDHPWRQYKRKKVA